MADLFLDEQTVPTTPAAGSGILYIDSGNSKPAARNDGGTRMAIAGGVSQASAAAQTLNAADTYLTNSGLVVPSWGLVTDQIFGWRFSASKTAAGIAAPTYNIRIGSAGTTLDTARLTLTGAAQTAVADTGWFEIVAALRSAGATAVLVATLRVVKTAAAATGFSSAGYQIGTSAAFDSTTTVGGNFVGLSVNPGTAGVWTVDYAHYEAFW